MSIKEAWEERRKLHLQGRKLLFKANKIFKKAEKFNACSAEYYSVRGFVILLELDAKKLQQLGDKYFINAVIARYDESVELKWHGNDVTINKKKYYWQPKNRKKKIPGPYNF